MVCASTERRGNGRRKRTSGPRRFIGRRNFEIGPQDTSSLAAEARQRGDTQMSIEFAENMAAKELAEADRVEADIGKE